MAAILREVLNAQGLGLTISCAGQSRVGLNISGTWTGLISFYFSTDGLNYEPYNKLSMAVFPTTTTQQSATANGNFEVGVKNFVGVRIILTTLTTGAPVVALGTSIDSSYQDAFLVSTSKYVEQTSGAGAANTVTVAQQANRAWRVRTLTVGFSAAPASNVNVQITDGASNVIWSGYATVSSSGGGESGGTWTAPLPQDPNWPGVTGGGVVNTPGNSLVIAVAAGGGSVVSTVNAEICAA